MQVKKAIHTSALVIGCNYCPTIYFGSNNLCLDNRDKLSCTQQIETIATLFIKDMSDWVGCLFFPTSQLSSLEDEFQLSLCATVGGL